MSDEASDVSIMLIPAAVLIPGPTGREASHILLALVSIGREFILV